MHLTSETTLALETEQEDDMEIFRDDDDGYLCWVADNPSGYVLNCERPPNRSYLMLHQASCHTISGVPPSGDKWTSDYIKVCSTDRGEIEAWAEKETGGTPQPCGTCQP